MKLCIAGIFHFDPRCASAVEKWLGRYVAIMPAKPSFIANEWSCSAFHEVQAQRPRFRQLLQKEWPDASAGLLDLLERSLAYEADAHVGVYPDLEVLWLGKEAPKPGGFFSYPGERLLMYRKWLAGAPMPADPDRTVELIGIAARRAATDLCDQQRDRDLARTIMDRAERDRGAWAAVVVGAAHVVNSEHSMLRVLEDHGYTCEVEIP